MLDSDKKSALERLKKGLYSRRFTETEPVRHVVHGDADVVRESWDDGEGAPQTEGPINADHPGHVKPLTPERRYAYKIIFIGSVLFLLAAIGIAAYTFFAGGNFVSVDNVDIQIEGPATIAGGDPLDLNVSVVNKNQTDMQLVDLIADYPQGTKDAQTPSKDLTRVRVSLGDIKAGQIAQQQMSSLMFGQEGDVRDITFTAEYRTAGSNAIFVKEKTYHVTISSSPLLVSIDTLDSVLSGQPFDMTVTVSSNTTSVTKDIMMSLDYPFGFSVVSSDPAATYGDNVWQIGDLPAGGKRIIHLKAQVSGQDGEQRTIHAAVGIQSQTDERQIATTIISRDQTFTIEKPFLGLDVALDGVRSDLAATAGRNVRAEIIWTNDSADKITNAVITATLSGNVLDKNSVSVDNGGYYDSSANTITWQAGRTDGLDEIAPGADGKVSFSVTPLSAGPDQSIANPQISISVTADGNRIDASGTSQAIETGVTRSIKLVSNLALSARVLRTQGPIANSGPVPPRVDQSTTYTIVWTVTNTSNSITGARVTATLPPYVSWTGVTSPADANLSYDQKTGTVTWIAGEVPPNADIGTGAKQVAFQVSLKPSANQAGTAPDIISSATITGMDAFTGSALQGSVSGLSTRTTTDLLYKPGDETVQQ